MGKTKNIYEENGVSLSKASIKVGDEVIITYSGLLATCGAESVTVHYGYGETWEEKNYIPMENNNGLFKASLKAEYPGSLNIAFVDSADNWDNNSSNNYSFKVSKKTAAGTASDKKEKTCKTTKAAKPAKTVAKNTKKKA